MKRLLRLLSLHLLCLSLFVLTVSANSPEPFQPGQTLEVYSFQWDEFSSALGNNRLPQVLSDHPYVLEESPNFLQHSEDINTALADQSYDELYITAIPQWHLHFITLIDGNTVKLMPYADRPDFMPLENGRWYSSDEMISILNEIYESTDGTGYVARGGVGIHWYELIPYLIGGAVIIAAAITLPILIHKHKKIHQ